MQSAIAETGTSHIAMIGGGRRRFNQVQLREGFKGCTLPVGLLYQPLRGKHLAPQHPV